MATIAALDVLLRMNIAEFTKGRTDAEAQMARFTAAVGRVNSAIAAVGVGAAVAGMAAHVSSVMEAIDVNAKLADRLDITTESLIALQHAADLAGVGTAEFNSDLDKMVKNLGEAAAGGGPAADALEMMGLSARALVNQNLDASLAQIANGIAQIENPAQRAAAAVAIFGKSGQALLAMLSEGADGLDKARKKVESLNATYSRLDASKVEGANDAITDLKKATDALYQRTAISIAPDIQRLAEVATSAIDPMMRLGRTTLLLMSGFGPWIGIKRAINGTADELNATANATANADASAKRFADDLALAKKAADELNKSAAEMSTQFKSPLEQLNDRVLQISKLSALGLISSDIALAAQAAAEQAYQANDPIRRVVNGLVGQIDALQQSAEELDVYRLTQANASEADIERVRALHQQLQALKDADEAEKTRTKNLEDAAQAIHALQTELDTMRVGARAMELKNLIDLGATDDMVQQAQALMGLIDTERAFQQAIEDTARAQEKLNDEMDRANGRQAGNFETFGPGKSGFAPPTVNGLNGSLKQDRDVRVDGFGKLIETANSIDKGIKDIQDIGSYGP